MNVELNDGSGLVVTWVLFGYTARENVRIKVIKVILIECEYSMFSHLYPISLHHFPAHIFPDQTLPGFLLLSTDFVTKKITVARAVYFYNLDSIFATKIFCNTVCTQSKKFYEDILASLERDKCGLENGV